MSAVDHDAVKATLQALADQHAGLIHPADVVDHARAAESPLHGWFEWDDGAAAEAYRLDQARRLLRVYVVTLPSAPQEPVRAFVSLSTDRKEGGGYRPLAQVMSDAEQRKRMLADALMELRSVRRKYETVRELNPVFKALDRVELKSNLDSPERKSA